MSSRATRLLPLQLLVMIGLAASAAFAAKAPAASAAAGWTLALDGLGKGTAPLDGAWQFHPGDDPAWADPKLDDSHWEKLTADKPWGQQGHESYAGYAWYRRSISITPAPGVPAEVQILIPAIDDIYEVYWNGRKIGQLGTMPPHLYWLVVAPQVYSLGAARSGVLAIRVYKTPLPSNDPGTFGGFEGVPLAGSPDGISTALHSMGYDWLRQLQFRFGLTALYALVSLLSFIVWLRDRSQWLLFWMAVFAITPLLDLLLGNMGLPYSYVMMICITQVQIAVRECAQWFLLLWLLQLHQSRGLGRFVRAAAIVSVASAAMDGALFFFYPNILSTLQFQWGDAFLTVFAIGSEPIPVLLVAWAIWKRKRLDSARWAVAIFATFNAAYYCVSNLAAQGERFTHWTLADRMGASVFTLAGNPISVPTILRTLLFLSIVYAVIRYSMAERDRQTGLEREIQNARELQQILVPETFPALPGFTLTSAYRPAQEVGGDFFQIIPLESGSTLVVLGDVSGKGLRAAMAVSLIVGAVRAFATLISSPAELLTQLNQRLCGRLQGGFATCVVMRLDLVGRCTVASAGHPAPFLNDAEMALAGALPLGIDANASYEEISVQLSTGDHFALYTDGLLEARSATGEIYSFERLKTLFATRPNATEATEAAISFGQDDDITVVTLTRTAMGEPGGSARSAQAVSLA